MSNIHKIKFSQAYRMVGITMKAGLVPLLAGSPAIGKSAVAHQIAKDFNLKLIDIRLGQCDITDLNIA